MPEGGVDFLQVAPATLARFAIDLTHQRDHVAEIADARFGQIAFLGAFARPGGDFVDLRLQSAEISATGAA